MPRSPSFAGIILAAGESSRMGSDKALLPWPPLLPGQLPSNETFLSCAIQSFSLSTDFVVVVAGKNEAVLVPVVFANGATLTVNPDPSRGQFSSLQMGLREVLNRGRDAALITLVDRPPVSVATIKALMDVFTSAQTNVWAVVPESSGRHGHPYIAGRELIEAFLRAAPTASAREIEREHRDHILYVQVDDPFVALNVNTPEEYAALCNSKSAL
jgi:molybdenum cofactor cytidylyltransferase